MGGYNHIYMCTFDKLVPKERLWRMIIDLLLTQAGSDTDH